MTKLVLVFSLLFAVSIIACSHLSSSSQETNRHSASQDYNRIKLCSVTKIVEKSAFEDSLSAEEYPELTVIQTPPGYDISIGAAIFSTGQDGYKITTDAQMREFSIFREAKIEYFVGFPPKGPAYVDKYDAPKRIRVATFNCQGVTSK